MADIDLRPLIRRSRGVSPPATPAVGDETRMMTRSGAPARPRRSRASRENAAAVLGRLNRMIERQVPAFAETAHVGQRTVSPGLAAAIGNAQQGVQRRLQGDGSAPRWPPCRRPCWRSCRQRKQALKRAPTSPVERATIEIVALLFQSILTEERIPAVGAGVVRAAADAGAAGGGGRAGLLRHHRPPGAAADRPHGRLRDGLRGVGARGQRRARNRDQAHRAGGRGLPRHRSSGVPDRADRVRALPRELLQERRRHAQGRVAGAAGRTARDAGDPVHDRAAQAAQRGAGAGGRAPVPVPGLGRRDGHHRGAQRCAERAHQGDARGRRPT